MMLEFTLANRNLKIHLSDNIICNNNVWRYMNKCLSYPVLQLKD